MDVSCLAKTALLEPLNKNKTKKKWINVQNVVFERRQRTRMMHLLIERGRGSSAFSIVAIHPQRPVLVFLSLRIYSGRCMPFLKAFA